MTSHKIYDMTKTIPSDVLDNFTKFITTDHWLDKVPGGFLTNSPKRKVHAFGNGGYDTTYWTAQMKSSKATLHTKPNPLPQSFKDMIPYLKTLFLKTYPDAQLTDDTFTIGVCNYYTEPDMYIAAHTDDNVWYPKECKAGNVFASITLYPEGEPEQGKFGRFQINEGDGWKQIDLRHNSVMIMPSSIEHRVQPFKKKDYKYYKPRINVTFRSVYPKDVNPLMNMMAISNHARYYCIPHAVTFQSDIDQDTRQIIIDTYSSFCKKYNKIFEVNERDRNRKSLIGIYRKLGYPNFRITNNMVAETFETLISHDNMEI